MTGSSHRAGARDRRRPSWRRIAVYAFSVVLTAGLALWTATSLNQPEAAAKLTDQPTITGIESVPVVTLPQAPRRLALARGVDVSSARLLASAQGQEFYFLESPRGRDHACFATAGSAVALLCSSLEAIGAGTLIVPQPTGQGVAKVYFGVAPDGFTSVIIGGRSTFVEDNVFTGHAPRGEPLDRIEYVRPDGTAVPVDFGSSG